MKNTPEKSKAKTIKVKKSALKNMDERGFGAILEDINDKFSIMIEGLGMTNQKVDGLVQRVDGLDIKVDNLVQRVDGLDQKVDTLTERIDSLEETMKSNFRTVFDYLSRIDEEIQEVKSDFSKFKASKVEEAEVAQMKIRIANLEYELAEVRRIAERKT